MVHTTWPQRRLIPLFLLLSLALFVLAPEPAAPVAGAAGAQLVQQQKPADDPEHPLVVIGRGAQNVAPGSTFHLEFEVQAEPGWYVYGTNMDPNRGQPTLVTPSSLGPMEVAGKVQEPAPKMVDDPTLGVTIPKHFGKTVFKLPLRVPQDAKAGMYPVGVSFTYMTCNKDGCLMPQELPFQLGVWVGQAAASAKPAGAKPSEKLKKIERVADFTHPVEVWAWGMEGVAAGSTFEIPIEFRIEPPWYIYGQSVLDTQGVPTSVTITDLGGFQAKGGLREPAPKFGEDPAGGPPIPKHSGNPKFALPLEAPAGMSAGVYPVQFEVTYQTCKDICLNQETLPFVVDIHVGKVEPASGGKTSSFTGEDGKVKITVHHVEGVEPGADFELRLDAEIEPGWHIYGLENDSTAQATLIEFDLKDGAFARPQGQKITEPPTKDYAANDEVHKVHKGKVTFRVPLQAKSGLEPKVYEISGLVDGQVCDDEGCLIVKVPFRAQVGIGADTKLSDTPEVTSVQPPKPQGPVRFEGTLDRATAKPGEVIAVSFEGEVEAGKQIPSIRGDVTERAAQGGLLAIILQSMVGALIALLTPCVYPMIPITVSVFTKQAEQRNTNVLLLAIIFCLGIITTFTGIGLILSWTLGEAGANWFATHWLVNLFIGGLFIWFAFSLFGYYDIQLPSWLTQRATSSGNSGGIASVILMGFVFSITTFTCVGPIVSTLLALAVVGGTWYAAVGMLAFSATFALPFFFLALFPKTLSKMPRSGGWLNSVKVVLGFVELAAAWKFLCMVPVYFGYNPLFRELVLGIWALTFLATAIYLLGKIRFPHDSPVQKYGIVRVSCTALFVALTAYCGYGAFGVLLNSNLEAQLSPSHPYFIAKRGHGIDWTVLSSDNPRNYDEVMAELRAKPEGERKPVFINFTGHI